LFIYTTSPTNGFAENNTNRPKRGSITIGATERPVKDDTPEIVKFNKIFVRVATSVVPSVVSVIPTKVDTVSSKHNMLDKNFSKRKSVPASEPSERRTQALGSGVIVTPDGYILTNYHVISGAQEIDIRLSDDRLFKAIIAGVDSLSDVAVLKIKSTAKNLPVAFLGNSDNLKQGDWVAAIGNPFSLQSTITQGIVSALKREVSELTTYQNFIQTDAAINPGNSGGALVNVYGEVIGINTLIYSQDGGFMGIGFAIPINMARKVMEDLIYEGRVIRGWIGLSIQELTEDMSRAIGIESLNGVLISDVYDGQPAAEAGIKRGDIVISINNQEVKSGNDLRNIVATIRPGTEVPVIVIRKGKKIKLSMKVLERTSRALQQTSPQRTSQHYGEPRSDGIENRTGISITDLNSEIRSQYNISTNDNGVIVTQVDPSLTDSRSTLLPGDLIMQAKVQGKDVTLVTSNKDYQAIAKNLEIGQSVLLLVKRSNTTFYIPFEFRNP
jgi:serine protease Do